MQTERQSQQISQMSELAMEYISRKDMRSDEIR